MIFTVKLEVDRIKKMQPFCGTFLDIVCTQTHAIFCSETGQCFAQIPMNLIGTYNEQIPNVRINTNLFFSVMMDGVVKFSINDSDVQVTFYGTSNEQEYKLVVPRQVSVVDVMNKNRLLLKSENAIQYSLLSEQRLIRLVSKTKSPFIVSDGFAFMFNRGAYVFQKSELPTFCCDSDLLRRCVGLTNMFRLCEDYLIFTANGLSVFIHKQKAPNVCDLEYIQKTKASRVLTLDMSKMSTLLNRLKSDNYDIRLNLDSRVCLVKWDVNRFEIPVKITHDSNDDISLEDALSDLGSFDTLDVGNKPNDSNFIIPYWTLKLLDRVSIAKVYITKRFYLLKIDKVFITINKER